MHDTEVTKIPSLPSQKIIQSGRILGGDADGIFTQCYRNRSTVTTTTTTSIRRGVVVEGLQYYLL